MVDLLIFSKDRAFQLHTALETIQKHMTGINNIFVQFSYSNEKFYEGYKKLVENIENENITFIDETEHGFYNTLLAILSTEIKSENIALEVDDSFYYRDIDISKCSEVLTNNVKVGRYTYGGDYNLFGSDNFLEVKEDYVIVDRKINYTPEIIDICLKYAFNISSTIHIKSDLIELLNTVNIKNPIELEHKGAESPIFNKYEHTILHKTEVFKQIHLNNFLKRYEEMSDVESLNKYFLDGEVIDIQNVNIDSMEMDMRWFNGEDIGRFPIFPWEIPPRYHLDIVDDRRKL